MDVNKVDLVSLCCLKLSIELDLLTQILYKTKNQQHKFKGYQYSQEVKKMLGYLILFLEKEESFEFLQSTSKLEALIALLNGLELAIQKAGLCYLQMVSQNYFVAQGVVQMSCLARMCYLCKSCKNALGV